MTTTELAIAPEPGPARLLQALLRGDPERGREPLQPEHLRSAAALAFELEEAALATPGGLAEGGESGGRASGA
jgi:hypothetical protein